MAGPVANVEGTPGWLVRPGCGGRKQARCQGGMEAPAEGGGAGGAADHALPSQHVIPALVAASSVPTRFAEVDRSVHS